MSKVKVRIAVAVDPKGDWAAYGGNGETDQEMMDMAIDAVEAGERRYFLTATLEIPAPEEVTAEAEESK